MYAAANDRSWLQVIVPKQVYFNSNSEPFKFNLESIDEVSIGDFYFIDPEELDQGSIPLTRPLLCKVMEIDTDLEIFTAEWWTMVRTKLQIRKKNNYPFFRKIRGLEKRCTNTRGKRMMKWQTRINFVLKMFLKKFNFEKGSN